MPAIEGEGVLGETEGESPEKELDLYRVRCTKLHQEITSLRQQLEAKENTLSGFEKLQAEIETLKSSKSSLEYSNSQLSERLASLEMERRVLEGRVGEAAVEMERARSEAREKRVALEGKEQLEVELQEVKGLNQGQW